MSSGFPCRTEVVLPGTDLRPADVFAPTFPPADVALDVSLVHPLPPSQPSAALATVSAGSAAQKQEAPKVAKRSEECDKRAWTFVAFVGETTGAWGQAAQQTVKKLIRGRCLKSGEEPFEVAHELWGALSATVAAAVGRQLSRARALGAIAGAGYSRQAVPFSPSAPGAIAVIPPAPGAQEAPLRRVNELPPGCGPAAGDLALAVELCGSGVC